MMNDEDKKMEQLERLLEDAGKARPEVPATLVQKVLTDAEAARPRRRPVRMHQPSVVERMRARFGQWAAVGGLAAASSFGFWIGIDPPASLQDVTVLPQAGAVGLGLGDAAELSGFGWELEES